MTKENGKAVLNPLNAPADLVKAAAISCNEVKKVLEQYNLNSDSDELWRALQCAAISGDDKAVKVLLEVLLVAQEFALGFCKAFDIAIDAASRGRCRVVKVFIEKGLSYEKALNHAQKKNFCKAILSRVIKTLEAAKGKERE